MYKVHITSVYIGMCSYSTSVLFYAWHHHKYCTLLLPNICSRVAFLTTHTCLHVHLYIHSVHVHEYYNLH